MGCNASVLYKHNRDVVLVPTDAGEMVCAPSLVSIPQSRGLVVLALFFCPRLTRTERDEGKLGRKREEREEDE